MTTAIVGDVSEAVQTMVDYFRKPRRRKSRRQEELENLAFEAPVFAGAGLLTGLGALAYGAGSSTISDPDRARVERMSNMYKGLQAPGAVVDLQRLALQYPDLASSAATSKLFGLGIRDISAAARRLNRYLNLNPGPDNHYEVFARGRPLDAYFLRAEEIPKELKVDDATTSNLVREYFTKKLPETDEQYRPYGEIARSGIDEFEKKYHSPIDFSKVTDQNRKDIETHAENLARTRFGVTGDRPLDRLTADQQREVLYGLDGYIEKVDPALAESKRHIDAVAGLTNLRGSVYTDIAGNVERVTNATKLLGAGAMAGGAGLALWVILRRLNRANKEDAQEKQASVISNALRGIFSKSTAKMLPKAVPQVPPPTTARSLLASTRGLPPMRGTMAMSNAEGWAPAEGIGRYVRALRGAKPAEETVLESTTHFPISIPLQKRLSNAKEVSRLFPESAWNAHRLAQLNTGAASGGVKFEKTPTWFRRSIMKDFESGGRITDALKDVPLGIPGRSRALRRLQELGPEGAQEVIRLQNYVVANPAARKNARSLLRDIITENKARMQQARTERLRKSRRSGIEHTRRIQRTLGQDRELMLGSGSAAAAGLASAPLLQE